MLANEGDRGPRASSWERAGWLRQHRAELGLSLRITLASLLTLALGQMLGLPQVYWAVLSAAIVLQASVGGSLKATRDRFIGTLGGAVWGAVVSLLTGHTGSLEQGLALALTVAPLALLTGFWPDYRVAPVTGIIVLLSSRNQSAGPVEIAASRVLDITFGCVIALAVALFVLPARAHALLATAAGNTLDLMAQQIGMLSKAFMTGADVETMHELDVKVREAMGRVETTAKEAARERVNRLTDAPDPDLLVRALRRVQQDLALANRMTVAPLPEPVQSRLAPYIMRLSDAMAAFLHAAGAALAARTPQPSLDSIVQALDKLSEAMSGLRHQGLTRSLSDEAVERLFGLAFGLEQLRQHLAELAERGNAFVTYPTEK